MHGLSPARIIKADLISRNHPDNFWLCSSRESNGRHSCPEKPRGHMPMPEVFNPATPLEEFDAEIFDR